MSDGATAFTSAKFNDYCESRNINNDVSSAEFPKSNGLAENGVCRAKAVIKKCETTGECPTAAISAYRALPLAASGVSPHELFFKRTPRNHLPHLDIAYDEDKATAARKKESSKFREVKRSTEDQKPKSCLQVEDKVWVYNKDGKIWNLPGVVLSQRDTGRSYWVRIVTTGSELLRNRKFLKPRKHLVTEESAHLDKEGEPDTMGDQPDAKEPPARKDVTDSLNELINLLL